MLTLFPASVMTESFLEKARAFAGRLAEVRRHAGAKGFEWYPYDTLANVKHLNELLTGTNRELLSEHGNGRTVLDLCCGDGDMSFFLESVGYRVVAVDFPAYNHNGMRGVRAMAEALGSKVEIREIDLDRQFIMPEAPGGRRFDLVLFLGALYHLRNPWFVLEELARHSELSVMSTRVANRYPNGDAMPAGVPLAYLLDEDSLNEDNSNYFIFSEPGLRLMLKRAHWRVLDSSVSGVKGSADPTSLDRDQRMFFLLRSTYGKLGGVELLEGWYEPEAEGWRWTKPCFTFQCGGGLTDVKAYVPDALVAGGPVTLTLRAAGQALEPVQIREPGPLNFRRTIPVDVTVEGRLSRAVPAEASSGRELGLVIWTITTAEPI